MANQAIEANAPGQRCPKCAVIRRARTQAKPDPGRSLEDLMPALANEWHPSLNGDLTPADVHPGSTVRVWWCCRECQHEWATPVHSRGRKGGGCPPCGVVRRGVLRATPKPGESFGDLYPEVAAEWHPMRNGDLKPTDVKPGSQKKVWWQCHQGHEWRVAPAHRRRGERCPECAAHQSSITRSTPKAGRSLAELYPEIAAEWHPKKNNPLTAADVKPGSRKKRCWKCREYGHDFETSPDKRTRRGDGCPTCRYKRSSRTKATPKPGESLAEKDPELAKEWHPRLNGTITPFDVRPRGRASAWWKCRLGHVWKAKIAPRAVGVW
jgi:hypothetical protein